MCRYVNPASSRWEAPLTEVPLFWSTLAAATATALYGRELSVFSLDRHSVERAYYSVLSCRRHRQVPSPTKGCE